MSEVTEWLESSRFVLPSPSGPVELSDLWHRYAADGDDWTLRGVNLNLAAGELVGLLGPSGCGKTTLLRLIAGFERPNRGEVRLQERTVAGPGRWLPPERRGVGMVFQDYALFPHLTAWQNACFGLRPGQDDSRASWLLDLMGLSDLHGRFPHQLSGGQRQRLALARALAPAPSVVLLDEPFSNLDVEVRLRLRSELASVLQVCGTTGLIVTHDPGEALAICDRVAVLRDGVIHQCAPPRELVQSPATAFVSRFVLQANRLPVAWGDDQRLRCAIGGLIAPALPPETALDDDACVMVEPHCLTMALDPSGEACVMGREFLGHAWQYRIQLDSLSLRLVLPLERDHPRGTRCRVSFREDAAPILYPMRQRVGVAL